MGGVEHRRLAVDPEERAVRVAGQHDLVVVGLDVGEQLAQDRLGDRERVAAPALGRLVVG